MYLLMVNYAMAVLKNRHGYSLQRAAKFFGKRYGEFMELYLKFKEMRTRTLDTIKKGTADAYATWSAEFDYWNKELLNCADDIYLDVLDELGEGYERGTWQFAYTDYYTALGGKLGFDVEQMIDINNLYSIKGQAVFAVRGEQFYNFIDKQWQDEPYKLEWTKDNWLKVAKKVGLLEPKHVSKRQQLATSIFIGLMNF